MRCRYLGWAGLELEHDGATLVIDPLRDGAAVFAVLGPAAAGIRLPDITPPAPGALAGLVTHLHRDHTDAGALREALAPGAPVFGPPDDPGTPEQDAALLLARSELGEAGLGFRGLAPWTSETVGPFTITALPAADGLGDPQVSWSVAAGGRRIVHGGDTMLHGWWWRIGEHLGPIDAAFLPVNGAELDFPHRRPASRFPAAMTPEQAAHAGRALGAAATVPIHFGAYDIDPYYRSVPDAPDRFAAAAGETGVGLAVGETLTL